ncbi:MAG: alkaline phosphatase D family protein [Planctomycetota bacterium]
MPRLLACVCALACLAIGAIAAPPTPEDQVETILFGSCIRPERPQPIWDAVAPRKPDVVLLLGDNVYADTLDMLKMRRDYAQLDAVEGLTALREDAALLMTWDDHDFGKNDAGREFPMRAQSQQVFLDFLDVAKDDPRRAREGVYHAESFGPAGRRVQFIMLDTRYHRSPLAGRGSGHTRDPDGFPGRYQPTDDPNQAVLGEAQWAWLAKQLAQPADIRIISSSIQVVAEDHGYETWANFPKERLRLLTLIRDSGAHGVVFLSGDRHRAEISVLDPARAAPGSAIDVGYPIIDVTSSSITNSAGRFQNEVNRHRWGSQFSQNNIGIIEIDWADRELVLEIVAEDGRAVIRKRVGIDTLARAGD